VGMKVPSARAELLRNYQKVLFHDDTNPLSERRYVFYLLLRPILQWLKLVLISNGLEPSEAESELFLFCCNLYTRFDSKKSSIVPYLERAIPWEINHLMRRFKRKELKIQDITESNKIEEEYYWNIPDIILEKRYVGKFFTSGEKYIISKILASDDDKLTQVDIATQLGVTRVTANKYISEIREKLQTYWRN
jgi:hypothetical protein